MSDDDGRFLRVLVVWCAVVTAAMVAVGFYRGLQHESSHARGCGDLRHSR